ncbi:MAG: helix-turn-helix domain-containing protein [Ferruginibacter sp.]|nr:helix-turn-helix domain-containing protein [Ferruginibacter sp.]
MIIIINKAKSELIANNSVSETAFNLGFASLQGLSHFFKLHTNKTPVEYVKSKKR